MERTDYAALAVSIAPTQAVDVLNERVAHVGRLNSEIAEWLAERRRLEEIYANGLRKLARRQVSGVDLGILSVPWSTLSNATETQADSHASLAGKIDVDVERPLREFTKTNRDLQAISTQQGNLGALARDVQKAQQKIEKLQESGEREETNKSQSARIELERAEGQWSEIAPFVFENLQALDEARFNHLRDVLTQLHTHEVDQVEKDRVTAEQCLNVLLNVEIADEIKTFVLKAVTSRPQAQRQNPVSRQATLRPNLAPTLSHVSNEEASQRTGSIQEEDKKKGTAKGLKRFSTVLGRKKDRNSKLPSQLEPMQEAPETKRSFGGFGRKKKESNNLDVPVEPSSAQRPYSPLRIGSEAFEPAALKEEPEEPANVVSATNGTFALPNGSHQNELADLEPPQPLPPVRSDSLPTQEAIATPTHDREGFSVPPADIDPITKAQQEAANLGNGAQPQYNVNIRDAPIVEDQDADAALASAASKLQMVAPPPQRRAGTIRGRRDGRNSTFIPSFDPKASQDESTSPVFNLGASTSSSPPTAPLPALPAHAANPPASTASTFSPAASASTFIPTSSTGSVFNPAASTSSFVSAAPAASASSAFTPVPASNAFDPSASMRSLPASQSTVPRGLFADATGDTQSIRSLTSTTSQSHRHPEPTRQGLNVSIIETISAQTTAENITTTSLIGEVALAYVESSGQRTGGKETVRIENASLLEKMAPNPAIVSASGKESEYTVDLLLLSKPQLAFKYQARPSTSQAPLKISTAWKIEPTQASVIISYGLNPGFEITSDTITISNVKLALTLEGAKATNCLSKPVGTFLREKNMIFWSLGDLTVTRSGQMSGKVLARFTTEAEAQQGGVEARFEIVSDQAGNLGSGLSISTQQGATDPFADESATASWSPVLANRRLITGSYTAR